MALNPAVPTIYWRLHPPRRMGILGRLLALAIALDCLFILAIAVWLQPNNAGTGTHTQLHLPPCMHGSKPTGYPCISCGMTTTSFAYFVRGNL